MAAALLRHRSRGVVEIASAGTRPARRVQPEAVAALAELGVDATDAFPKPLSDEVIAGADVVVTMGCGDGTTSRSPGRTASPLSPAADRAPTP